MFSMQSNREIIVGNEIHLSGLFTDVQIWKTSFITLFILTWFHIHTTCFKDTAQTYEDYKDKCA